MKRDTIVIVKRSPGMPAWQAEFVGVRGRIDGQCTRGGVFHWLVSFERGPALEYLPHELEEVQPQEAAA
jgi:hypothetical protein